MRISSLSTNRLHSALLVIFLLVVALVNIALHYLTDQKLRNAALNADALYLPAMFKDIIGGGGSLKDWHLTPAPYFFPDFPLFFVAYHITDKPYIQALAYALIQTILTFIGVWVLVRITMRRGGALIAATVTTLVVFLCAKNWTPFAYVLNSAFHFGIFLSGLFFIACSICAFRARSRRMQIGFYLALLAIGFLSTLSDSLFIPQFALPFMVIAVVFLWKQRKLTLKNFGAIVLVGTSVVSGNLAYGYLGVEDTRYPATLDLLGVPQKAAQIFGQVIVPSVKETLVFGLLALYALVLMHAAHRLLTLKRARLYFEWVCMFAVGSAAFSLLAVCAVREATLTDRYLIPAYYFAAIIAVSGLRRYYPRAFNFGGIPVAIVVALITSWSSWASISKHGVTTDYYLHDIECVDNILREEGLSNGIAWYWDAKLLQMFSRLPLNVAQYNADLKPHTHITSKRFFRETYDFAIINNLVPSDRQISVEKLKEINGPPKAIRKCGEFTVVIYGKDRMRVGGYLSVGRSLTWKACELPTQNGTNVADCEIQKHNVAEEGFVTHGPYQTLAAGTYRFELSYSSNAATQDVVGRWDAVLALPTEAKQLNIGDLHGTNNNPGVVSNEFSIAPQFDGQRIEIRSFALRDKDLRVKSLKLTRTR